MLCFLQVQIYGIKISVGSEPCKLVALLQGCNALTGCGLALPEQPVEKTFVKFHIEQYGIGGGFIGKEHPDRRNDNYSHP